MLSEIVNGSSHEGAAVEKERSIEQRVIWLSISLGIWHANILLTLLDEALSQPLLEFRRSIAILDLYPWNGLRLRQFLLHILLVVLLQRGVALLHLVLLKILLRLFLILLIVQAVAQNRHHRRLIEAGAGRSRRLWNGFHHKFP